MSKSQLLVLDPPAELKFKGAVCNIIIGYRVITPFSSFGSILARVVVVNYQNIDD